MTSELWAMHRLADLCESVDYGFTTSAKAAPPGPQFLRITDIVPGFIDWAAVPFCDLGDTDAERFCLHHNDIVVARTGATTGVSSLVQNPPNAVFASYLVRLKIRREHDARYVAYAMKGPTYWDYVRGVLGDKSAQPNASASTLSRAPIPTPPLPEQRAIAAVLGALDDKIEVNRKTARVLEGIARAVFTSWFVDFDPVRYNMQRRGEEQAYERMGRAARFGSFGEDLSIIEPDGRSRPLRPEDIHRHIAHLFPDRLVDSPIGEVPEGWRVGTLGDMIEIVKGRSYTSEDLVPSETALVTLKSFARGGGYRPDGLKSYAGTYKPEQVVKPGELVISCTDVTQAAEVIGRPAIVRSSREFKTLVASLDTLIIRPRNGAVTRAFLYFMGGTDAFVAHTYAHTSGTTVLHLAKQAVPSFQFPLPPFDLVRQFDGLASLVLDRLQRLADESEVLAALRDALLPKLISGELRIADAERIIEGNMHG